MIITLTIQVSSLGKVDEICYPLLSIDQYVLKTVWEEGCKVKTPYCKNMFEPNCEDGCASIVIKNHNLTKLPEDIVKMTTMKQLSIQSGPLNILPAEMEKMKYLTFLDLKHNNLNSFNVDITKYEYLSKLYLSFNNITTIDNSVFLHETLQSMRINSNIGLTFPANIKLPFLFYLDARNNSVEVPSLGKDQLPAILYLYLNGNKMPGGVIPEAFNELSSTLVKIGLSDCEITSLPVYLNVFEKVKYLDARNNYIATVPSEVTKWIQDRSIEAYFHNNSLLCKNDAANYGKYCEALCSKYCYAKVHKNNDCDDVCNSKECNYDDGDCI
eukprot:g9551.t1